MSRAFRTAASILVVAAAFLLFGCPDAAVETYTATVSVTADLATAFDANVAVQAVGVSLANDENSFDFDLAVDAGAQTAAGSQTDVPLGDYTATIVVEDADGVVGQTSSSLVVREDTTITVVIEITVDDSGDTGGTGGTGGSIDVTLE